MAKSLNEIIAGMEAELAELKDLQKRLAEVGQQLTGNQSITDRKQLFSGDKIRINGAFGTGLGQEGSQHQAGIYTVELVEPENYDGELTVLLAEASWIEFETIAKEVGISIVR